jgi:hypothetical protein
MSVLTQGGIETLSSSTSLVDAAGPTGSAPRGPTINVVYNLGGGRYWTHRQRPPGGPLSMSSSTLMVDVVGPIGSAP